jgi:hypothetical protein
MIVLGWHRAGIVMECERDFIMLCLRFLRCENAARDSRGPATPVQYLYIVIDTSPESIPGLYLGDTPLMDELRSFFHDESSGSESDA